MHSKNIMHWDIKPENILIDQYGNAKLADFGWAINSPSNWWNTICGTLDYFPTEMLNRRTYSSSVDIWACGVLAYELSAN